MKLFKSFPIFILLPLFVCSATAQEKLWSLEQCIDYALENNIDIKSGEYNTQLKEQSLSTSKWSRLPDLNASIRQGLSFGRTENMQTHAYDPKNATSTQFNISANMPIFTGFRISNEIEAAKLDVQASLESLNRAKESLAILVTSNYLNVLFNKELENVQQAQADLSAEQLSKTEILVQSGKVSESQLYDAKALLAKDELNLVNAQNEVKLSLLSLVQNLELGTQVETFRVTDPQLDDPTQTLLGSLMTPNEIYSIAVATRPMIKEQELLLESSRKQLKVAKAGYYPTLNLSASYGSGYAYYLNDDNPYSFADQWNNSNRTNMEVTLSIPIFNRFQVRNSVNTSKINILNQGLSLDKSKKDLFDEIQKAYYNAVAAQRKYESSKESVEASTVSYKYVQEKYDVGKASVFELNEAKVKMVQSQSEQVQSKYEFIFRTKILDFYRGVKITL